MVLLPTLDAGGAERATATLSRQWVQMGHRVKIVTFAASGADFYHLDARVERSRLLLGADSKHGLSSMWNNLTRIVAVRREVAMFRPQIVIGMMAASNVIAAFAALGLNCKVVGCERTHPPQMPLGKLKEFVRKLTYGMLNAVVALTAESAEWLRANTNARRVVVIPNSISLPLGSAPPDVDPVLVCGPGREIVLAVGRLGPEKGFSDLITAFAAVHRDMPNWDLVIVGDGAQRSALEEQIRALALSTRVFMPGRVGNTGDWYSRASLFALTSRFEGFPNALLEAMAHGIPAVSYDCDTGPRDIIRHDTDGKLVPASDISALASALYSVMSDSAVRMRLASRAAEVQERFSERVIMQKWNALFRDLGLQTDKS